MPIYINNSIIKVEIDEPGDKYTGSRFDSTGFIRQIKYKEEHTFCTTETGSQDMIATRGAGMCNEFGIDKAIGYDECNVGQNYIKIGVGRIKKDADVPYDFFKMHDFIPARTQYKQISPASVAFISDIPDTNGYACKLMKMISITENDIFIHYFLKNLGNKDIVTSEYCHNFISIDKREVVDGYTLEFPFKVEPTKFGENVNPGNVVDILGNEFRWKAVPKSDFFFSNLGKPTEVKDYYWKLYNSQSKVFISEWVDVEPSHLNLWGKGYVVSPEIFVPIYLKSGEEMKWMRRYRIGDLS